MKPLKMVTLADDFFKRASVPEALLNLYGRPFSKIVRVQMVGRVAQTFHENTERAVCVLGVVPKSFVTQHRQYLQATHSTQNLNYRQVLAERLLKSIKLNEQEYNHLAAFYLGLLNSTNVPLY